MAQSLNITPTPSGPGSTPVSLKALQRIVTCIEDNHLQPKSFIKAWLSSSDPEIVKSRSRWATGVGIESTGRLLSVIGDILVKNKGGREFWEEWVLSQAIILAKNQQPPSGSVPNGFYINTSKVTPSMFDMAVVHERDNILESSMPFLYNLIQSVFTHNLEAQVQAADLRKSKHKTSNPSLKSNSSSQSKKTHHAIDQDLNHLGSDDESLENSDVRPLVDQDVRDMEASTLADDNKYVHSWDGSVLKKLGDQAQNIKN
ncbi:uncharacterized protein MELLADRAFT_105279 [Melampsora larici-populina 98AG31]|uniref:Uncharacterized protein n=1 Tax=Melampsora larici-populina (strain 98AG31 / pathotype 3-4-7) TaxID=747676 RepID=F4RHK9_MELLP|nr:uncharacterized protein MELLADRAFT_105279 [Melampsora larici-populina 98AG31]EGG08119.1 hypothetical protein MELLADRAFT_105279 [Melampsora larici-populina 98AG31]